MSVDKNTLILIGVAVLCLVLLLVFLRVSRKRKQKKMDREQMDQYIREETLDQALANRSHRGGNADPQQPIDIQYDTKQRKIPKGAKALRLIETCKDSSITRQYLFLADERVFIGAQDGRGAVFSARTRGNPVFCEFFSLKGEIYARNSGSESRLIRGKRSTVLVPSGLRIHSGDVIETPYGSYLTEIIQN